MVTRSFLPPPRRSTAISALLCEMSVPPTLAQTPLSDTPPTKNVVADAMQEASERFHIPVAWPRALMRAESHGDEKSVSEKGAIGLIPGARKRHPSCSPGPRSPTLRAAERLRRILPSRRIQTTEFLQTKRLRLAR
jgi:hypothetical protein